MIKEKRLYKFCDHCLKDVTCSQNEREKEIILNNKKVKFIEKYYICDNCHQEFYDDLYDYNVSVANESLRKENSIITVDEINEILEKYNIGKKNLSLILGLGEITITRYLDGQNPTRENSNLLKNIYDNPMLYELYLRTNFDKITKIAYKKSLGKTIQIEMKNNNSKLYNVALYLIERLGDVTPLALQKLLYFVQLFSKNYLSQNMFLDDCKAWVHGPVYSDIYDCFSYYKWNNIDYSELLKSREYNLNEKEIKFVNLIIKYFGCYSPKILEKMTHLTDPWLNARKGLEKDNKSIRVIELKDIEDYRNKINKKFKTNTIEEYSKYLFKKVTDKLIL